MDTQANSHPDLISATSQMWKVSLAGYALFAAVLVCAAAPYAPLSWPDYAAVAVQLGCCLLAGAAMLYAARTVRCPKCDSRWLSWAMRSQPFTQWLHVALSLHSCPQCGYQASGNGELQSNPSLERP